MHAWRMNDRLRREASRNLVDAALKCGSNRFVQESVTFVYADGGEEWISEDHAVQASPITASALDAEAEARRFQASGGTAVILRFGSFYGPDSAHTADALKLARRGFGTIPGARHAYVSSIRIDDAAAAVVVAATEAASGTYNVVDDDPVTRRDLDAILAWVVGREKLRPMPSFVVRLLGHKLDHVVRSQRVSNRALRTATSWQPRYPGVRQGLPAAAVAMGMGAIRSKDQPEALAP